MNQILSRRAVVAGAASLLFTFTGATHAGPARANAAAPCGAAASTPSTGSTPMATTTVVTPVAPQPTEQNPAGDIPDNQAFVRYVSTAGGYSIEMPEGWARIESGSSVSFSDKLHTFTVEIACAPSAPTVESANASEVPVLTQSIEAFTLVGVSGITLPAGPAIKISYQSNSGPDEVTGKQHRLDVDRYEIFKDGRQAIITLAAPAGSDNVDISNQVSSSFQWTS